jgi:hypothetical protein
MQLETGTIMAALPIVARNEMMAFGETGYFQLEYERMPIRRAMHMTLVVALPISQYSASK